MTGEVVRSVDIGHTVASRATRLARCLFREISVGSKLPQLSSRFPQIAFSAP